MDDSLDLLLVEAALRSPSEDDPERGHLTADEAIDFATRARARSARIVHYPPSRRPELERMCEAAGPWILPALPGLTMTITDASGKEVQPLPQDDPKQRRPDITRARKLLKWEPQVPLAEGLVKTIEYFRTKV